MKSPWVSSMSAAEKRFDLTALTDMTCLTHIQKYLHNSAVYIEDDQRPRMKLEQDFSSCS